MLSMGPGGRAVDVAHADTVWHPLTFLGSRTLSSRPQHAKVSCSMTCARRSHKIAAALRPRLMGTVLEREGRAITHSLSGAKAHV